MFVDPDARQIEASRALGAQAVELHTGRYADARSPQEIEAEFDALVTAAGASRERARPAAAHGAWVDLSQRLANRGHRGGERIQHRPQHRGPGDFGGSCARRGPRRWARRRRRASSPGSCAAIAPTRGCSARRSASGSRRPRPRTRARPLPARRVGQLRGAARRRGRPLGDGAQRRGACSTPPRATPRPPAPRSPGCCRRARFHPQGDQLDLARPVGIA